MEADLIPSHERDGPEGGLIGGKRSLEDDDTRGKRSAEQEGTLALPKKRQPSGSHGKG